MIKDSEDNLIYECFFIFFSQKLAEEGYKGKHIH